MFVQATSNTTDTQKTFKLQTRNDKSFRNTASVLVKLVTNQSHGLYLQNHCGKINSLHACEYYDYRPYSRLVTTTKAEETFFKFLTEIVMLQNSSEILKKCCIYNILKI